MKEIDKFLAKVSWVELSFVVLLVLVVIVLFANTAINLVLNAVEFVERTVSVVMPDIVDIPRTQGSSIQEENLPSLNLPADIPACCGVMEGEIQKLIDDRRWAGKIRPDNSAASSSFRNKHTRNNQENK